MSKDQLEELQQERYPWWRWKEVASVTEEGSHATGSLAAGGVTGFQQLVKSPSRENSMTVLAECFGMEGSWTNLQFCSFVH